MDFGQHVIDWIVILISLIVTALLVQQVWLAIRLSDRNDEWLDAMKAVSDELKGMRRQSRGDRVDGTSSGGGAPTEASDDPK